MKKTIKSMWESYSREVLPEGASDIQRNECRKAFYGGAGALSVILSGAATVSEPEAMRIADNLEAEINAFMEEMRESI